MKKVIILVIIFILVIGTINISFANEELLNQIVDTFNNLDELKEYEAKYNVDINATRTSNGIVIESNLNGDITKLEYILNGNILEMETQDELESLAMGYMGLYIYAAIGENQGLDPEEVIETYTILRDKMNLQDNGIGAVIEENNYKIQIDITKKIELVDSTNVYITVEDIENAIKSEEELSSLWFQKGKLFYSMSKSGNITEIRIIEKKELTDNAYKSVLSSIEELFGNQDSVSYFKQNYSSLEEGNKQFKGIKVEVNPEKTGLEKEFDENSEFVRLTINMEEFNSAINQGQDQDQDVEILPNAGNNNQVTNILIIIIVISSIAILKLISKKKN